MKDTRNSIFEGVYYQQPQSPRLGTADGEFHTSMAQNSIDPVEKEIKNPKNSTMVNRREKSQMAANSLPSKQSSATKRPPRRDLSFFRQQESVQQPQKPSGLIQSRNSMGGSNNLTRMIQDVEPNPFEVHQATPESADCSAQILERSKTHDKIQTSPPQNRFSHPISKAAAIHFDD